MEITYDTIFLICLTVLTLINLGIEAKIAKGLSRMWIELRNMANIYLAVGIEDKRCSNCGKPKGQHTIKEAIACGMLTEMPEGK